MKAILQRRSIRAYKSTPVAEEDVEYILRAAMAAPSAGNQQPWHYIVIDDRDLLNRVPDVHPYAEMCRQSPAAILVCGDPSLEKHTGYWVQDCSAATQNILIAATAKGLGSVWLGVYPREERMKGLGQLLHIPEEIIPFALIALGYPAEEKGSADRYKSERVHKNGW